MANKCKYYKLVRQVSYNSGQTWSNVDPPQYQQGDLYESESTDCGDTPTPTGTTVYRWVDSGETCSGTSLYVQQIKQVSYDGGTTWQNVVPIQTSYGSLISDCSPECGGIPEFTFYYSNGKIWSECCPDYYPSDYAQLGYYTVHENPHADPYKTMTAATIGECVNWLQNGTFNGCEALENVTMTDNVVFIDEVAFQYCSSLTSITLSDNITEIRGGAFRGCYNLPNITLPSMLEEITHECFISNRNLSSISIPPLVSFIGQGAFEHCISLSSVTFQSNENLTEIFMDAFNDCTSLTSITIPDSVETIGSDAFANCSNLGEIVIGCNVESIGQRCFINIGGNNNLSNVSVYFKSVTPPTYNTSSSDKRLIHAFSRYINGPTLNVYVPNEALEAYSYHFPTSGYGCNLYGYNPAPCG